MDLRHKIMIAIAAIPLAIGGCAQKGSENASGLQAQVSPSPSATQAVSLIDLIKDAPTEQTRRNILVESLEKSLDVPTEYMRTAVDGLFDAFFEGNLWMKAVGLGYYGVNSLYEFRDKVDSLAGNIKSPESRTAFYQKAIEKARNLALNPKSPNYNAANRDEWLSYAAEWAEGIGDKNASQSLYKELMANKRSSASIKRWEELIHYGDIATKIGEKELGKDMYRRAMLEGERNRNYEFALIAAQKLGDTKKAIYYGNLRLFLNK